MKIGPAVLAQRNGWETEGNRMTEGEIGGGKGKKMVRGVGEKSQRIKQ